MSAFDEELLRSRFETLAPEAMSTDWGDVRRRVRDRRRRTAMVIALVAAFVLVLFGCTAVIGQRVLRFGDAPRSPQASVSWLGLIQIDRRASSSGSAELDPRETRRLLTRELTGRHVSLDLTPTTDGFCATLVMSDRVLADRFSTDCLDLAPGQPPVIGLSTAEELGTGAITQGREGGPAALVGWISAATASNVELVFEGGDHIDVPDVVQVSDPIAAGFFLVDIPVEHQQFPRRLARIVARSGDGAVVASRRIEYAPPPGKWTWPRSWSSPGAEHHGFPRAADASRETKLEFPGTRARIWLAPAEGNVLCFIFHERTVGGAGADVCLRTAADEAFVRLDSDSFFPTTTALGDEQLLWWGRVPVPVARIRISFQDGDTSTTLPRSRFVVYPIPARHYVKGHRPTTAVLLDAHGGTVERVQFDTHARGRFPCPNGSVAAGSCP